MATIGLTIAGSSVGSTLGGPIGALIGANIGAFVGGILDSQFIFPALFGSGDSVARTNEIVDGPRLDDVQIISASEGSPVPYAMGPEASVGGVLIWAADRVTEIVETEEEATSSSNVRTSGGKGGGGGSSTAESVTKTTVRSYEYYQNFAVAVHDARDGPASRLLRVWANGDVIYDNGRLNNRAASAIRFYPGNQTTPLTTMAADASVISAAGGYSSQIPSYNGVAIVEFDRFFLNNTGGAIPQLRFLIERDAELRRSVAVSRLCARAGIESGEIDTSAVSGCVRGLSVSGVQPASSPLQGLMLWADIYCRREGGKLVFFDRGTEDTLTIPQSDISASDDADAGNSDRGVSRSTRESDTFSAVDVEFIDPQNEYEAGVERELSRRVSYENIESIRLPITMNAGDARACASRFLYRNRIEGGAATLSIDPKWARIVAGDLIATTDLAGEPVIVRASLVRYGVNGRISVTGTVYDALSADVEYPPDPDVFPAADVYLSPLLRPAVLQLPALSRDQSENAGYFVVAGNRTPSRRMLGAQVFDSADDSDFAPRSVLAETVTDGFVAETLSYLSNTSAVGVRTWAGVFYGAPLRVELFNASASLVSVTKTEAANGLGNVGVIVADGFLSIFGFARAELDGSAAPARQYLLRDLIYGLYGTDAPPRTIPLGTRVYIAGSVGALAFVPLRASMAGRTRFARLVPFGGAVAGVESIDFQYEAATQRPIRISRGSPRFFVPDSSEDANSGYVEISWRYFGRYGFASMDEVAPGLDRTVFRVGFVQSAADTEPRAVKMVSGATSVRWSIEELIEAGVVGSGFGIVNTLGVFDSIGYHYAQIVACDSELGDGDPFFVEIENDTGNFEKVKRGLA